MIHMYVTKRREDPIFFPVFWKSRGDEKQKKWEESFFRKLFLDDSFVGRERIDHGFP